MHTAMTSSGRELLKWLGLLLMTGDHLAKVFYGGYLPVISELGRVAFPLFAIVMACNLAQPGADPLKFLRRLLPWALVAQPFFIWTFGGLLPLNVLWSFALVAACLALQQRGHGIWAGLLFFFAGVLVEYRWFGGALILLFWLFYRDHGAGTPPAHQRFFHLLLALVALIFLCVYNGNAWALLSVPLILVLGSRHWPLPRIRWFFHLYYVGHLALFGLIAWWIGQA